MKIDSKQEDNTSSRILYICIVISWCIALAMIALFIYGQFVDKHDILKIGSSKQLDGEWDYVTSDGRSGVCRVPYRLDIPMGVSVELTSLLPDDISDGDYMVIMAGRDIRLYIDDELRFDHNQSDTHIPGKIVKSGFFPIELTAADAGRSIRIVKDEPGEYNGNINEIRYGDMYAVTRSIMAEYAFRFFAAVLLLIMGLVVCIGNIVIGVVYTVRDKALRTLGFGFLVTACWLITDSYMYQFAFNNMYIDGLIGYMLTPLIPISFLRYINELQESRYEKIYAFSIVFLLIDEIAVSILHFTGIRSFDRTLYFNNGMVALVCLLAFVVLIIDYRAGHVKKYKWVAIGLCGLIFCGILEIICINFHITPLIDMWFTFGIYFLLISALIHTVGNILNKEKERRKAVEANMVKSNFLANMSHEIRTPINAMMGMNEMIQRECEDPTILEYSEHISRSGRLLLSIIGDVLDFSKIESGKLNIVSDPYNLASLISDVYNLANQLASSKSLEVRFDVEGTLPSVPEGDENRLKQIIINLITNSVKYTRRGYIGLKIYREEITETYSKEDDSDRYLFCVEVSDSGIGIRKDDIPKLFDSFERVDENRNRNIQGTGLGLSIVKSLTEAMGGTITVESKYGKGSTFKLKIPQRIMDNTPIGERWRRVAEYKDEEKSRVKYKASFKAPKAKVMAVDDNASNLMIITQLLKQTEVELDAVDNGEEAIRLAAESRYDVILLDHMMPDPDGIAVLKAIREEVSGINHATPVIVLTANATENSRAEYLRQGFDDFVAKPVSGEMLEKTLSRYIPDDLKQTDADTASEDAKYETTDTADRNKKRDAITENSGDSSMDIENKSTVAPSKDNDYNGLFEQEGFAKIVKAYGNKDFAYQIMNKVAEDSLKSLDILKEDMDKGDYTDYAIKAHGIKGMMASLYYEPLRERSFKHEMAAKEDNIDFIKEDYDGYRAECIEFCHMILGIE